MSIPLVEDQGSLIDVSTIDPDLNAGEAVISIGLSLEFKRGAGLLADNGFLEFIEENNGTIWLSPTKKLLDFYRERLKRFGPNQEV